MSKKTIFNLFENLYLNFAQNLIKLFTFIFTWYIIVSNYNGVWKSMIKREENPEFLNSFLDYSITILNKSPNSIREYNYDLAMFLKYKSFLIL